MVAFFGGPSPIAFSTGRNPSNPDARWPIASPCAARGWHNLRDITVRLGSRRATGRTLLTAGRANHRSAPGRHRRLLGVLGRLVDAGNRVIVG